ncbi:TlpA family protein disulfide reductase [bacterium]|nr:TlpA family protein disulfide reductase [bacterium]
MWQDYKDEWVQVISIGVGHSVAEAKAWQQKFGLTYPVLADPNGAVWNKFGMMYIPHNTIIDDLMICLYTNSGFPETTIRNLLTTHSAPLVKILHTVHPNTENTVDAYNISARIYSGGNLLPASIKIYWNIDGSMSFDAITMANIGGDMYQGYIPAQAIGTTVYYYVHAEADNGKVSNFPLLAPDELAIFEVLIDNDPPVIDHKPVEAWLVDTWPAEISAEITDIIGVQSATLEFNINGGSTQSVAMTNSSGDIWTGIFTGTVQQDDVVNYRIRAIDSSNASNEAILPTTGWYEMNISELVQALVLDFDGNTNSGPVLRDALLALGIETHYLNEMPPLLDLYKSIWVCLGVAPNNHMLDGSDDTALANYLLSGHSLYLEGGNFWKDDPRVDLYFEFGVGTTGSGAGDAGAMNGEPGSMAAGMTFNYTGDNNSIDMLKIKTGGVGVLRNVSPDYLTMISKDGGTFKTIASSIEFGGLVDGSVSSLLEEYTDFFDLDVSLPTPTPTPDPGDCDTLGVKISMPSHDFGANDLVNTIVTACNPDQTTYDNVPLFVILDVYGDMYFYPTFSEFAYETISLPPGETEIIVLPDFNWPEGLGETSGINWYAGMTNPEMSDLLGDYDMWTFGWH